MKKNLIIGACIALVIGGIIYANVAGILEKTGLVIDRFHQRYNAQDFEYIYEHLASDEFRRGAPRELYLRFMQSMYDKAGRLESAKRGLWGIFYKNIGLTFNVVYRTKNEKLTIEEYFTLVRKDNDWLVLLYEPKIKK